MTDIKRADPAVHKRLTGRTNENIVDCLHWLAERNQPMWIRQVLVEGYTDDDASLAQTRELIASLGESVRRVEVLPYHTLGVFKWEELGIPYTLEGVTPPSPERTQQAQAILRGEVPAPTAGAERHAARAQH